MKDPYQVLGVSPNATDDEVKQAYRSLAKKYHPDAYANNPLADLAAEKMKEINEAYDTVNKMRSGGGSSGYGDSSGYGGGAGDYDFSGGYSSSGQYANIRNMINQGRIKEAQAALDAVPSSGRDAEWHFLKGSVMYKVGWVNEAMRHFQTAAQMDPSNQEYRHAVEVVRNQMNGTGFGGNPYGGTGYGNTQGCTGCDICAGLACADCLCNGCGGC